MLSDVSVLDEELVEFRPQADSVVLLLQGQPFGVKK
jgi:hypothetical protein